jgi:hypothetical protein
MDLRDDDGQVVHGLVAVEGGHLKPDGFALVESCDGVLVDFEGFVARGEEAGALVESEGVGGFWREEQVVGGLVGGGDVGWGRELGGL